MIPEFLPVGAHQGAGPGPGPAAAWAQARAQGPGPAQRPRPGLQSFSPRPGPGQSLGMRLTCMMPGMPRTFLMRLLWILPGSGHLKQSQAPSRQFPDHWKRCQAEQNHQNLCKSTNMPRVGLRILLFESHSHFLSVGNPPNPSNPIKIYQKSTGAGFAYRDTLWANPITGSNGKSPCGFVGPFEVQPFEVPRSIREALL